MDFNGYEIYVTEQSLPSLEEPWTKIEANDKTFYFQRTSNRSRIFRISGYIQKNTWALTREEAEGLNNELLSTPSGTFRDGYGTLYHCLVEDWEISPVAGINKYTFSLTGRILG